MIARVINQVATWINTEIVVDRAADQKSLLMRVGALGDKALTPLRYLTGGKKIEVELSVYMTVVSTLVDDIGEEKSWQKTALMILLVIPSTVLGLALKGVALASKLVRLDAKLAVEAVRLRALLPTSNAKLAASLVKLVAKDTDLNEHLVKNAASGTLIWQDPVTLQKMDDTLTLAAANMEELIEELALIGNSEPTKMTDLLLTDLPDEGDYDPIFHYCFFSTYSLFWLYELARNSYICDGEAFTMNFSEENAAPFFKEDTMQHRWRCLVNATLSKLKAYKNDNNETLFDSLVDEIELSEDTVKTTSYTAHDQEEDHSRPAIITQTLRKL